MYAFNVLYNSYLLVSYFSTNFFVSFPSSYFFIPTPFPIFRGGEAHSTSRLSNAVARLALSFEPPRSLDLLAARYLQVVKMDALTRKGKPPHVYIYI